MSQYKIVSILRPFDKLQSFFVYEDSNKIDGAETQLSEFPQVLVNMANKYELTSVTLIGPEQFLKGIKKNIETYEVKQYGLNKLDIHINNLA